MDKLQTITPVDGSVYVERELARPEHVREALDRGRRAQADWRHVPVGERARLVALAVDAFVSKRDTIAEEIFSFPGGRRFHFTDPSGNELAIWSDQ